jgi:hypothetical protein
MRLILLFFIPILLFSSSSYQATYTITKEDKVFNTSNATQCQSYQDHELGNPYDTKQIGSPLVCQDLISQFEDTKNFFRGDFLNGEKDFQCNTTDRGIDPNTGYHLGYTIDYDLKYTETHNCIFRCKNEKPDLQCKQELNDDEAYFDHEICSCVKPCRLPESPKILIKSFCDQQECTAYKNSNLNSLSNEWINLSCSFCPGSNECLSGGLYGEQNPEYCGENAVFVNGSCCDTSDPLGDCDGDGDPNATDPDPGDPDVNSENPGSANDENDPCANLESTLQENQRLKIGYPPGVSIGDTEKYDWGFIRVDNLISECNAIIYTWFQCPQSQKYNKQLNKCEKPSDVIESDENCPSGYAKKELYDFSRGLNYIPLWLENLGAENGNCYYRYNCIDNYTLVKIEEVSCSSEWAVNDMEISSDPDNNSTIIDVKNPYENLDPSNPLDQDFANRLDESSQNFDSSIPPIASSSANTASALEDIKNALDGKDQNGTDEDVSEWTGDFQQGDDLLSSISDSLEGIKSSYSDMFSKINQGFDISVSPGSDPTFSTTVRGKEISISFCPFLSQVAPIFYYIFYVTFMILGIKLFYLGFKMYTRIHLATRAHKHLAS